MTDSPESLPRDPLFGEIADLYESRDPMPAGLVDKVLVALATEDLDAEYELLHLVARTEQLAGVRGGTEALTIEFSNGSFSMLLRVSSIDDGHRRVDGWVAPAKPMRVSVTQGDKTWDANVGRLGRFEFATLPTGLSRIWLTADDSDGGIEKDAGAEQLFATPMFEL